MLESMDAGGKLLFPFLLNLRMEIRKKWKAHLSWGVMARKVPLIETFPRCRHLGPLPWQVKPRRGTFHNNCEPHDLILLRASAAVGPESREADGCPSFFEKRDRRERSVFIENSSQCMQISPSRTSRACSSPQQKKQRLCVSSGVK